MDSAASCISLSRDPKRSSQLSPAGLPARTASTIPEGVLIAIDFLLNSHPSHLLVLSTCDSPSVPSNRLDTHALQLTVVVYLVLNLHLSPLL